MRPGRPRPPEAGTSGSSSAAATSASGEPATLRVWLQGDTLKDIDITALNAEFEAAHPGVTVDLQEQTWGEYTTKVTTGLADTSDGAPDVLELGNTQVAQFAGSGALMELDKADFENSDTWLGGLEESSTYDGKLVAVPYYAGVRVGIYRTDLAEQAGANPPFNSLDEMQAAGVKLLERARRRRLVLRSVLPESVLVRGHLVRLGRGRRHRHPGRRRHLDRHPGFTGGQGGSAAAEGPGRRDLPRRRRPERGRRRAGDGPGPGGDVHRRFLEAGRRLRPGDRQPRARRTRSKIFVVPGSKPGTVLPQFLGGSDIAINAKTPNADLATAYTAMLTGQKYQEVLAGKGYIANSTSFEPKAGDETSAVVVKAASHRPVHPELEELDQDRGRQRAAEHVRQDPDRIGDDRRGNRRGERADHRAAQQLIVARRPARNSDGVPGRSAARHLFVHRQFRCSTAMT